ncbi:hypothetical protein J3Q64DRAFT_1696799 [Phycomyces blakesleeanus]|uniref:TM7S3/TM198-like domain-containing protein n=2 Tax=Phycomyces blakesleeanus TaxID=4837 RepID=A0A162XQF7_PHYB8|nr:hypothetical protein PHYBLDRAFT_166128 [Phycomyces blakesleeanus NRRL 1555(-)]OAD76155.1 hypothetical protein PHYBLDRAFT_166128 [Phycomyces blakesleeanus NRRL 1555(-)]|eukprot:XP_018294195.1 hypothetical protein PHYBLDRAFT_166128 [Phycomyces blakesleeanus NRRL 1555(-)]
MTPCKSTFIKLKELQYLARIYGTSPLSLQNVVLFMITVGGGLCLTFLSVRFVKATLGVFGFITVYFLSLYSWLNIQPEILSSFHISALIIISAFLCFLGALFYVLCPTISKILSGATGGIALTAFICGLNSDHVIPQVYITGLHIARAIVSASLFILFAGITIIYEKIGLILSSTITGSYLVVSGIDIAVRTGYLASPKFFLHPDPFTDKDYIITSDVAIMIVITIVIVLIVFLVSIYSILPPVTDANNKPNESTQYSSNNEAISNEETESKSYQESSYQEYPDDISDYHKRQRPSHFFDEEGNESVYPYLSYKNLQTVPMSTVSWASEEIPDHKIRASKNTLSNSTTSSGHNSIEIFKSSSSPSSETRVNPRPERKLTTLPQTSSSDEESQIIEVATIWDTISLSDPPPSPPKPQPKPYSLYQFEFEGERKKWGGYWF